LAHRELQKETMETVYRCRLCSSRDCCVPGCHATAFDACACCKIWESGSGVRIRIGQVRLI